MEADFSRLYRQLGVPPDCSLEQFKQAYRRRIAELHPDRHSSAPVAPPVDPMLAELIAGYTAATRFHKEHGRLPGASMHVRGNTPGTGRRASDHSPPRLARQHVPVSRRDAAIVGLLLIAGAYIVISGQREPAAVGVASGQPTAMEAVGHTPRSFISTGMDMHSVREIQGPPTYQREQVWEYGPSWIRFEEGNVVEWHDSPLYPLRVSRTAVPVELQR